MPDCEDYYIAECRDCEDGLGEDEHDCHGHTFGLACPGCGQMGGGVPEDQMSEADSHLEVAMIAAWNVSQRAAIPQEPTHGN